MTMGSFWDHFGIISGSSSDGFKTKCWALFHFVFTFSGHAWDMFGHTFGKLLANCFKQIEISKSNETLPEYFSIENKP